MALWLIIGSLRLCRLPAFQILYACHISTSQPVFLCSFRTICRHLFSPSIICSGRLRHCPAIIVQIVIKIYSKIPPKTLKTCPQIAKSISILIKSIPAITGVRYIQSGDLIVASYSVSGHRHIRLGERPSSSFCGRRFARIGTERGRVWIGSLR